MPFNCTYSARRSERGREGGRGSLQNAYPAFASPLKILPWFSLAVRVHPGSQ